MFFTRLQLARSMVLSSRWVKPFFSHLRNKVEVFDHGRKLVLVPDRVVFF